MFARRLLQTLVTISFASCLAWADSIKLKSGDILRGTITEEDATSVTLAYEAAKGIRDERKIPREEIEQIVKEDPADRAWAEVIARLPTSDLMTSGEYDLLIQKVEAFLKAHATSMKVSEARRLLEVLRDERGKITAGGMKLDGRWLTAEQYQREKFWVDGRVALKHLSDSTKSGRSVEALRQFEKIEATYKGTTVFVRAVETAKIALNRYSAAISEAIRNQPQLEKQRRDGLASLPPSEKKSAEQAQAAQAAAAQVRAEDEKKSGTKWLTLDPFNLAELEAAKKVVDMELARLATLRHEGVEEQEASLRQIDQAIKEGKFDLAGQLIQRASSSLSGIGYFRELQESARAEAARLDAEKKAADAARAEAQRRAAEATPAPPPPPKQEEKDPLEEAINPVAKAVLESDLGKRVNREEPPPATPPSAPDSGTGETITSSPKGESAAPPTTEPSPSQPAANPTPKKKSDSGMTTMLYGLAGLLVVLLLALLLTPVFKKKAPPQQTYPDNFPPDSPIEDEDEGESKQG